MSRILNGGTVLAALLWIPSGSALAWQIGLPTPQMTEPEMLKQADLVVEGRVIGVNLLKRWTTDDPSGSGYEQGDFRSWVLVSKTLKGPSATDDTVEVFTHAYKEGPWSETFRKFVYDNTEDAITPGARLRFYLKWNPGSKRYERIHFNSGYIVLENSKAQPPTKVGEPAVWSPPGFERK